MKAEKASSRQIVFVTTFILSVVVCVCQVQSTPLSDYPIASENEEACAEAMFMGTQRPDAAKAARLACLAQHALQRNWFPDPIAGLFSYQTWNGMDGFWQDGIAIETMTNTMYYGNHSRYFSVIKVS